jgi:hypothetical protein
LPQDFYTRAFGTADFLFGLTLVFRDAVTERETLAASLALKFVSGHPTLLFSLKNAERMPLSDDLTTLTRGRFRLQRDSISSETGNF